MYKRQGYNVSLQVLDAILCHNGEMLSKKYEPDRKKTKEQFLQEYHDCWHKENASLELKPMTLEGCVVRISDVISYIGKDIEEWRARAGLTQLQLALIIGLKNDRQYRRICCDCDYEFPRKSWNGLSSADYKKASLSAYSENNNEICAEETKNRGFNLSGYEIVRAQFFSTRFDPAVTISSGKIVFNTACLKKFENIEYVELLFNSVEKCIAVRPCERNSINAIKWGTIRDGRWAVLPKSCKGFSEPLYELMGWNKECKYKLRGQFCGSADEQVMIFELEEPEVLVQEKTAEQFAEEPEKKEEAQKPVKKILYPEAWAYNFGESTNRTVFLQRVAYRGNWDILRPARTVEGMEIITREVLDDLLESAEKLIDKMRCANYA